MKTIMTIFVVLLTTVTFAQKNPTSISPAEQQVEHVEAVTGTVHYNRMNSCPFYIEIKRKASTLKLYPVDLPEKFRVDGRKIIFDYSISEAEVPLACDSMDAVNVSNVKWGKTLMR